MPTQAAISQKGATPAKLACARPRPDTLEIRIAGTWHLGAPRPSSQEIEREFDRQPARRATFDGGAVESWDSALLTFLDHVFDLLAKRSVEIDRSGLPEGVQRLLALAAVVPEKKGARSVEARASLLERIGARATAVWDGGHEFLRFIGETTIALANLVRLRARVPGVELLVFIQDAGFNALPIVTLISFLVGLILAFVGSVQLKQFGATIYVANLVQIGMAREMGAIMTGIIMAGRTGAAYAAQLGTMKVTEEIDALKTLGINPVEYLVLPRLIALSLMLPLLCIYSDVIGILGGGAVGVGMLGITSAQYIQQTLYYANLTQFSVGVIKSAIFGVLIALSGCLRGVQCGDSASAVGDAATSAVVTSIVLIVVTDGLFAVIFNALNI